MNVCPPYLRPNSELEQHDKEIHEMHIQYRKLITRGMRKEAQELNEKIREKQIAFFKKKPKPRRQSKKPGMLKRLYLLVVRLSSNAK